MGRHWTFVNYRTPFMWTVYTDIVRRLDRRAVVRVDEVAEPAVLRGRLACVRSEEGRP